MNSFLSSLVVAIFSGVFLLLLEYGIVQPLASRHVSPPPIKIDNSLAIAAISFGSLGLLGGLVLIAISGNSADDTFCLIFPTGLFAILGLFFGFLATRTSYRLALSGISVSIIAIAAIISAAAFLMMVDRTFAWCRYFPFLSGC